MFADVLQCLLHDPKHPQLERERVTFEIRLGAQTDLETSASGVLLQVSLEGDDKPEIGDWTGLKVLNELPDLTQTGPQITFEPFKSIFGRPGVRVEEASKVAELHDRVDERLGRPIVDLARQPTSLVLLCLKGVGLGHLGEFLIPPTFQQVTPEVGRGQLGLTLHRLQPTSGRGEEHQTLGKPLLFLTERLKLVGAAVDKDGPRAIRYTRIRALSALELPLESMKVVLEAVEMTQVRVVDLSNTVVEILESAAVVLDQVVRLTQQVDQRIDLAIAS